MTPLRLLSQSQWFGNYFSETSGDSSSADALQRRNQIEAGVLPMQEESI